METTPALSVVVPCYNEEGNLRPLLSALKEALDPLGLSYEIIITDDCSGDQSWEILKSLAAADTRIRGLRFATNRGQSAALWAGIRETRGRTIVTMDADMQNDPKDIPSLLEALKSSDCACGTRIAARAVGDNWVRRASSRIANGVRNALSGENITDAGCCFRAFKRECVSELKFFKGMHRFLPTLIKLEGYNVVEIAVRHHPRAAGVGHYGVWNRLFASFYDLLAVRWMKKRMFRISVAERLN
jgi:glycosyltransferase involved in cell wall biosynthesis